MYKNIYAYTASGASYPEFVSINEQTDGSVTVSVRAPATFDVMQSDDPPLAVCGNTVEVRLSPTEFRRMADAVEIVAKQQRQS